MKIAMTLMLMGGLGSSAACSEDLISASEDHLELSATVGDAVSNSVDLTVTIRTHGGLYLVFNHSEWLRFQTEKEGGGRRQYRVYASTGDLEAGIYEARAHFWTGQSGNDMQDALYLDVTLTVKP